MFKKVFLFLITYFIVFPTIQTLAQDEDKLYFIVTAYYSPLPDQEYYLKWSYEADIKLNWGWVKWASWKEVFNWMLAWPKKYDFWTKIYLEWLGTWVIADRWWAIVAAWQRWYDSDRIDVWMWYGDEWLKKALAWWKRKVSWKIINDTDDNETSVWINFVPWKVNLSRLNTQGKDYIYTKSLWIESSWEDVKKLKEKLKSLWIYNSEINWVYSKDLINALVKFQLENWIIKTESDYWAWYWWLKTRDKLAKLEQKLVVKNTKTETKVEPQKNEVITLPKNIFDIYVHPESSIEDIKKLQEKLSEMQLYSWAIAWKYNDIKDVLISYQLDNDIIKNKSDNWAWYFWPKTREELKNDYALFVAKKEEEDRNRRKLEELKSLALKQANDQIEKIWTPKLWDVSQNVRELQKALATLWHFEWKDTAIYWEITKQSIYEYQVSKNLVSKITDPGAWKIWEITKAEIKKDLTKLLLDMKLRESNLMAYNDKKAWN